MRFKSSDAGSSLGFCGTELTGESLFEDRLPETLNALQLGIEVGFEAIDDGELILNYLDDSLLFD